MKHIARKKIYDRIMYNKVNKNNVLFPLRNKFISQFLSPSQSEFHNSFINRIYECTINI